MIHIHIFITSPISANRLIDFNPKLFLILLHIYSLFENSKFPSNSPSIQKLSYTYFLLQTNKIIFPNDAYRLPPPKLRKQQRLPLQLQLNKTAVIVQRVVALTLMRPAI